MWRNNGSISGGVKYQRYRGSVMAWRKHRNMAWRHGGVIMKS
jgi:hypothetical protein